MLDVAAGAARADVEESMERKIIARRAHGGGPSRRGGSHGALRPWYWQKRADSPTSARRQYLPAGCPFLPVAGITRGGLETFDTFAPAMAIDGAEPASSSLVDVL
jgi:hypothetical protein